MALQVTTAADGVVRDAHYVVPTGASAAVRTLLLEPQRTNLLIRSQEFGSWSNSGTCNVTADTAVAPDGTATADLLTATSGASARFLTPAFTGDGTKCVAVFVKAGTSTFSRIQLRDTTAAATRHQVQVAWSGGVPTLSTTAGAGTLYPVESYGNGWYRLMFSVNSVVAANTNELSILPDIAVGTNNALSWGAQAEDAVVPSSYIPTAATTVTRNADSLYWALASLVPREMTVYVRTVATYAALSSYTSNNLLFALGASAGIADNNIAWVGTRTDNRFRFTVDVGGSEVSSQVAAGDAPVMFDVVESRCVLGATLTALYAQSINGAAETTGSVSASAGSATAFAAARFWLAGLTTGLPAAYTNVAIALGTKTRAEMRAIAGVT
jgi:hypothetical protein